MPKRRRSNLDLRWSIGVYLGTMMTPNEALIGLPNGDVARARSVARLIPSQQWRAEAILAIEGTPAKPTKSGYDDSVLESLDNPHLFLDAAQREALDDEEPTDIDMPLCLYVDRKLPSLRITKEDLVRYGYTDHCPRCEHTRMGGRPAHQLEPWGFLSQAGAPPNVSRW